MQSINSKVYTGFSQALEIMRVWMEGPGIQYSLKFVRQPFWLLVVSKRMHGLSTSMLLLLHFAFMLRVVKMLLKEEVGGSVLNSHGNYIADHGKILELCF